jgi:hypothetical protein
MEANKEVKSEHVEPQGKQVLQETTIQAHNATLAAILQESKPDPRGKGYIRLYCICGLIYLCSTMTGQSFYAIPKDRDAY